MDTLIQRRILVAEAGRLGIHATDDEIQREIAATPAFRANGQFREELYRQVLSQNRLTPPEYEAGMRTSIVIRKLEGILAAGALSPRRRRRTCSSFPPGRSASSSRQRTRKRPAARPLRRKARSPRSTSRSRSPSGSPRG